MSENVEQETLVPPTHEDSQEQQPSTNSTGTTVAPASTTTSNPTVVLVIRSDADKILRAVLDTGAKPYCDVAGIPRLRRGTDAVEFLPWPIRSRQVEAWIAKVFYDSTGNFVKRSVLQQVLLVLEAIAWENQQQDPELADVIEHDPVLSLVFILLSEQRHWEGTATKLLAELCSLAWSHGLNPDKHPAWPKDAARLSNRLKTLTDWLRRAGIRYTQERTAFQRKHVFDRLEEGTGDDEPASSSSRASSCRNSNARSLIRQPDADDAENQLLQAIIGLGGKP